MAASRTTPLKKVPIHLQVRTIEVDNALYARSLFEVIAFLWTSDHARVMMLIWCVIDLGFIKTID